MAYLEHMDSFSLSAGIKASRRNILKKLKNKQLANIVYNYIVKTAQINKKSVTFARIKIEKKILSQYPLS